MVTPPVTPSPPRPPVEPTTGTATAAPAHTPGIDAGGVR
jgi:hypothetical protein